MHSQTPNSKQKPPLPPSTCISSKRYRIAHKPMPCSSFTSTTTTGNSSNMKKKDGSSLREFKLNESTFLASLMPKKEIGVDRFLDAHPKYDGRGALIAIFDSGVDPAADGLQVTSDGKPKVLDVIDCTGSGDIDTSKVVKADSDGRICGASGTLLVINTSWKNPSGEWHVGYKLVYELFTEDVISRLKKERKKKWDEKNQEEIVRAVKQLADFDQLHCGLYRPVRLAEQATQTCRRKLTLSNFCEPSTILTQCLIAC
ncbi:tripeptidyl-peptidase 2 isoform X2 [Glycine max]|nr:tripeptidyl-peptidase 2-like isoform X2 [Glycine max]